MTQLYRLIRITRYTVEDQEGPIRAGYKIALVCMDSMAT
jgi:hypothetical protein